MFNIIMSSVLDELYKCIIKQFDLYLPINNYRDDFSILFTKQEYQDQIEYFIK